MRKGVLVLCAFMCAGVLWAGAAADEGGTTVRVGAAMSLSALVDECIARYEQQHPGTKIVAVYGSSGSIRRQVENGAPLDVFLSASMEHMDALQTRGLIYDESRVPVVTNSLVLIVPQDGAAALSFADLVQDSVARVAIGEPSTVPAGKYAVQILEHAGVLEPVLQKVVYAKNVRQVLYYVESGEADAGIVYRTEALGSEKARVVARAGGTMHDPVVYPGAVLQGCSDHDSAQAFLQWLTGGDAQVLFDKYGFGVP